MQSTIEYNFISNMAEVRTKLAPKEDHRNYIEVETLDKRYCKIFVNNFSVTTIGKIKTILEWELDCEMGNIKLMFMGFKLHQDDKTLSEYNIPINAKLNMTLGIPGGGMLNTSKIIFTDITRYDESTGSVEGVKRRKIGKEGPRYHVVVPGLNFLGYCNQSECQAQNKIVVIQIGIPKECVHFSYTLEQLECPVCKQSISRENCIGMGLHKCKADIEYKTETKQGKYTLTAGDEFAQFISTEEGDNIEYRFIRINVKPFEYQL